MDVVIVVIALQHAQLTVVVYSLTVCCTGCRSAHVSTVALFNSELFFCMQSFSSRLLSDCVENIAIP